MNDEIAIQPPSEKLGMNVLHLGISGFQLVMRAQVLHCTMKAGGFHHQGAAADIAI